MSGPAAPFNKGRLVLVFAGLSLLIIGGWLLLRQPEADTLVGNDEPLPAEQPIAFYLAQGDAARGERVYARCAACHTIEAGGRHSIGPNLQGVMGSALASRPGFESYSDALRRKGGRWDWEPTNAFLRSPRHFVPGTRMAFGGVSDPQDRADLMLYLNREGGSLANPAGTR